LTDDIELTILQALLCPDRWSGDVIQCSSGTIKDDMHRHAVGVLGIHL
jgi:hypothetical protein